MQSPGQIGE